MQAKSFSEPSDISLVEPISGHIATKSDDDLASANPPLLAKLPAERLQHYLHVSIFKCSLIFPQTGMDCADRIGTAPSPTSGTHSRNLSDLIEKDMSSSRNIPLALQAHQELV
jgi:hypothetical protein